MISDIRPMIMAVVNLRLARVELLEGETTPSAVERAEDIVMAALLEIVRGAREHDPVKAAVYEAVIAAACTGAIAFREHILREIDALVDERDIL